MAVVTLLEGIRQALEDELARDERVFLIGQDIGAFGGPFKATEGLQARFGETRVVDAPISEAAIVGAAVGAAYMGLRPVAEMQFIDFLGCGFDMLTNFAAKSRYRYGLGVPMVVRGPCGGGVSGGPFHSANPEAWFLNTPGVKIVEPSTAYDAKGLLKSAIRDDDPVLFLEHKALYRRLKGPMPDPSHRTPIGRANVVRPGREATVITYGAGVDLATRALDDLDVEILDLRTVWPLDEEAILESVARTSRVLVLQEPNATKHPAPAVLSLIAREAFTHLDAPPALVAPPDTPVPFAPVLEDAFLPSAGGLRMAVEDLLGF